MKFKGNNKRVVKEKAKTTSNKKNKKAAANVKPHNKSVKTTSKRKRVRVKNKDGVNLGDILKSAEKIRNENADNETAASTSTQVVQPVQVSLSLPILNMANSKPKKMSRPKSKGKKKEETKVDNKAQLECPTNIDTQNHEEPVENIVQTLRDPIEPRPNEEEDNYSQHANFRYVMLDCLNSDNDSEGEDDEEEGKAVDENNAEPRNVNQEEEKKCDSGDMELANVVELSSDDTPPNPSENTLQQTAEEAIESEKSKFF